jgi:hypothetical protein
VTQEASPEDAGSSHGRRLRHLIKPTISAALLLFLLTRIDVQLLLAGLRSAHWIGVGAALLVFLLGIVIRAWRWQVLLHDLCILVSIGRLTAYYLVGALFNVLLPTGFGGDAMRAAQLAAYSGRPGESVGSVVMDRLLGIVALLIMGAGAIIFGGGSLRPQVGASIGALLIAILSGWWLLRQTWVLGFLRRVAPERLSRLLAKPLRGLYAGLEGYSGSALAKALAISFLFNATWVGVNMLLGWSLGIRASLGNYLAIVPVVSLSLLLPSIGGLGVREVTYVGLMGLIGVPAEDATALGLLVYGINMVTALIGGIVFLRLGLSLKPVPAGPANTLELR